MNNENYARDPRKEIVKALMAAGWDDMGDDLWQKSDKRLLVDSVGVFLFQLKNGLVDADSRPFSQPDLSSGPR